MERQGFLIKSNSLQKMGRLEVRANCLGTNVQDNMISPRML